MRRKIYERRKWKGRATEESKENRKHNNELREKNTRQGKSGGKKNVKIWKSLTGIFCIIKAAYRI